MKYIITFFLAIAFFKCSAQTHKYFVINGDTLFLRNYDGSDSIQLNKLPRIWGTFTGNIADQTDLQNALNTYQPLNTKLTSIGALNNASGYLFNNGSGTFSYTNPSGTGDLLAANNLSDVASAATSRSNLGIGNIDNTSDANKPISTATQTALDGKQATLVSGTNIKTVGGVTLLGSGDIPTGGGPSRVWLPNNVINNNAVANTLADVTGLSFPVVANTTYSFKFFIIYSSAATTTGSRWGINGPATTFLNYYSRYTINSGTPTHNWSLSGYNLPAASNASSLTTNSMAIIEGVIRPSADGTVIARFASEISSSAITAIGPNRSYVEYQIIE